MLPSLGAVVRRRQPASDEGYRETHADEVDGEPAQHRRERERRGEIADSGTTTWRMKK